MALPIATSCLCDATPSRSPVATQAYRSEDPNVSHDQDILEPVAVVGFSIKFPDDATSPDAFWNMLLEKRCVMTGMPPDRANMEAFYHVDGTRPDVVCELKACDGIRIPNSVSVTHGVVISFARISVHLTPLSSQSLLRRRCQWILSIVTFLRPLTAHSKTVSRSLPYIIDYIVDTPFKLAYRLKTCKALRQESIREVSRTIIKS
jgi:Beta-ketoacyl synthase, N-terminal domain